MAATGGGHVYKMVQKEDALKYGCDEGGGQFMLRRSGCTPGFWRCRKWGAVLCAAETCPIALKPRLKGLTTEDHLLYQCIARAGNVGESLRRRDTLFMHALSW